MTQYKFTKSFRSTIFFIILATAVIIPCDGTLIPPCARSIFLGKFAPATVVFPASGPINVPVGLVPYVTWDKTNNNCAQPSSASITLTLNCAPVGGGNPVVVGPVNIPVTVPTVPGLQPLGGPANVTIPAGTLPGPSICTVVGTYTVTFSGGSIGAGTLSGTGDTEVCIVEPSPLDPTIPRLDMAYIPLDGEEFPICRRGDQGNAFFLITNNDLENSVNLTLESEGRQIALLPDGFDPATAPDDLVFAISSPVLGTDVFAAGFADELSPGELLHGDPTAVDPQMITRDLTLPPGESAFASISIRSFGMCADGSCNERNLNVFGNWEDGSPALTCVSTVFLVGDTPPKTPLFEWQDNLKVAPNVDAIFSGAIFSGEGVEHVNPHTIGNVNSQFGFPGKGTLVRGEDFQDPDFPSTSSDYMRTEGLANQVEYNALFYAEDLNFQQVFNYVTVNSLPTTVDGNQAETISVPLIWFVELVNPQPLDVILDVAANNLEIMIGSESAYNGSYDEFLNDASQLGFYVGEQSCRWMSLVSDKTDRAIESNPIYLPVIFKNGRKKSNQNITETMEDTIRVFDQEGTEVSWTAAIRGDGITLAANSGAAGTPVIIQYDPTNLPPIPETTLGFVDITSPDAINNPYTVPVAIRRDTTTPVGINDDDFALPLITELKSNYPNPFNPSTKIRYQLAESSNVTLKVFDATGKEVATLENDFKTAGRYEVSFNAENLSSGIYFYRLESHNFLQTKKMILLK